ncbi:hypothetical protein COC42_02140 [Sphingomonas spermidinifaciens]|uniref:SnoaL-like domain-containing protein n=1 Tax=Sphingomonas spermidinifaciens TaxID=1141889 RepID=A0A2A4B621_9SPHN|nr:nuclear transport factor 2 family protein [Sphingomonas spermidinifaciens]PCD03239.1 hypothetical protein COC42_02140 [Sphingomonas spermidinifaciens]
MELTEEERRSIEWDCTRLVSLYATLNDEGRWAEVAALYAEDGVMTRPTAPDVPIEGRAAVLASFEGRPPRVTRHICSNIVIDVEDADHASGASVMLLFTAFGPPLVGNFDDRFVRTGEGWRFAERRGSLTFAPS